MIMNISALTSGFAILTSLLLSSCSFSGISSSTVSVDGNEAEATMKKTVKIGDFDEIEASQGIKVIFVQGVNPGTADIATTPSAKDYIKVEVKDKTLKAYYDNPKGLTPAKIKGPTIIRLSSPVLSEVELSSAAHMTVEGNLNVKGNFEIDLNSAASFDAENISCINMNAELSSSASAYVGVLTGNLDVETSSSASMRVGTMNGNLDGEASSAASISVDSLSSSKISAEASSAASIKLDKILGESIKASASSGAEISLSGKVETLEEHSSSGGSISRSNLALSH